MKVKVRPQSGLLLFYTISQIRNGVRIEARYEVRAKFHEGILTRVGNAAEDGWGIHEGLRPWFVRNPLEASKAAITLCIPVFFIEQGHRNCKIFFSSASIIHFFSKKKDENAMSSNIKVNFYPSSRERGFAFIIFMSPCLITIALTVILCVIYPPFAIYSLWLFAISFLLVWTTRIYNNASLYCDSSGITVTVRHKKYLFHWDRIEELYFLEGGGEILAPISLNIRMQGDEEPSVIIIDKLMFQFSKEKYRLVRAMIEKHSAKKYDLEVVRFFEN